MGQVTVQAGGGYPVAIAQGSLLGLADTVAELRVSAVAIVTDRTVERLWGEPVQQALSGAGIAAPLLAVE
ncbi:MAG: 3-dehydroquinate synthase, partial [Candidatus Dormiibacterota bacterium]